MTMKIVKLKIKVPPNVQVVTELVPAGSNTTLHMSPGKTVSTKTTMEMDLTTHKSAEWLRKKSVSANDCVNCCCVRG
ncbi:hypothetical protein [Roseibium sp. M-1]